MSNNRSSNDYNPQSAKAKTPQGQKKPSSDKKKIPFTTALGSQQKIQQTINELKDMLKIQEDKAQNRKEQLEKKEQIQILKMYLRQYSKGNNQKLIKDDDFDENMVVPVDGDILKGSQLYSKQCLSCHSLESRTMNDRQNGPALGMIYGRRVGYDRNFKGYSQQLLKKEFFWNKFNLYRFMFNPNFLVKYTNCGILANPIKSESDRADIIEFLKQFYKGMSLNVKIKAVQAKGYDLYQTQIYKSIQRRKKVEKVQMHQKNTQKVQ